MCTEAARVVTSMLSMSLILYHGQSHSVMFIVGLV